MGCVPSSSVCPDGNLKYMRFASLEGRSFGRWQVISRASSIRGMARYLCRCECGSEQVVYAKHLRSGSSRGCHPCSVKRGAQHPQFTGVGEITANWWLNHVGRSVTLHARKPLEISITIQDAWDLFLKQNRQCALSGLELSFPKGPKSKGTASLDRIDSSKGYVPGNVQWVHKRINIMKNVMTQNEFIGFCHAVTMNQQQGEGHV
jgi:hypothetical protein